MLLLICLTGKAGGTRADINHNSKRRISVASNYKKVLIQVPEQVERVPMKS
jgi:hypothetical protein